MKGLLHFDIKLSKGRFLTACASLLSLFGSAQTLAESVPQPTIAIIIDDLGHNYQSGAELVRFPYPLTLAFLPGRRFTLDLAQLAKDHDKEIMLHLPMENTLGYALGKGGLTHTMGEQEFKQSLAQSLRDIPYARGLNNHMGSFLTSQKQSMRWLMESLKQTHYYFVDSRTTAASVAAQEADAIGIPHLVRDVFLDHEQTPDYVHTQFERLLKIANTQGSAIAIGHPHQVTIDYLSSRLAELDELGVRMATVSALWQLKHPYASLPEPPSLQEREARLALRSQNRTEQSN